MNHLRSFLRRAFAAAIKEKLMLALAHVRILNTIRLRQTDVGSFIMSRAVATE